NAVLNVMADRLCLHSQSRRIFDRNVERDLIEADYFYRIYLAVDRTLDEFCNDRTADAAGSVHVHIRNVRIRNKLARAGVITQVYTCFRITRKAEASDERRSIIAVKSKRCEDHSVTKTNRGPDTVR